MADGATDILHNLKRRWARERANATRFSMMLEVSEDSTPLDDLKHYRVSLRENLDRLISLDDSIHYLLPAIKMEPFKGDVETWSRFWEQFRSSIDEDASL